jgi:hypothetical protein
MLFPATSPYIQSKLLDKNVAGSVSGKHPDINSLIRFLLIFGHQFVVIVIACHKRHIGKTRGRGANHGKPHGIIEGGQRPCSVGVESQCGGAMINLGFARQGCWLSDDDAFGTASLSQPLFCS